MPKSYPRRNAEERQNGRFRQVFTTIHALFGKILEMAVGQRAIAACPCPARREILAATVPRSRSRSSSPPLPRYRQPPQTLRSHPRGSRTRSHSRRPPATSASMPTARRGEHGRGGAGQGNAWQVDDRRHAGRRAKLGEIARKTVRYIHRRMRMIADAPAPARSAAAAPGNARPAALSPRHHRQGPRPPPLP